MLKKQNKPVRYQVQLKIKKFGRDKNIIMYLFKDKPSLEDIRLLSELVIGFEKLNKEDKRRAEDIIEDLFSEQEVAEIFPYLSNFPGTEFCCRVAKIPRSYPGYQFISYKELPTGGGIESHNFDEKTYKNYPLKFSVRGWYDSEEASDKELERKEVEKWSRKKNYIKQIISR